MPDNIWWKGLQRVPIEKQTYKCSCPKCGVSFNIPEDLPETEDFHGLPCFIVFCPTCGQKMKFSLDTTPTVRKA